LPEARTAIAKLVLSSEQNLLILRSILFSIFALVAATTLIRRQHRELDRSTLRAPFYTQCYLTAPFALAISVAATLVGMPAQSVHAVGTMLTLAGILWYVWVETRWFRLELDLGTGRAFALASWSVLKAGVYKRGAEHGAAGAPSDDAEVHGRTPRGSRLARRRRVSGRDRPLPRYAPQRAVSICARLCLKTATQASMPVYTCFVAGSRHSAGSPS